jgi:hypothetical protein
MSHPGLLGSMIAARTVDVMVSVSQCHTLVLCLGSHILRRLRFSKRLRREALQAKEKSVYLRI